MGEHEVDEEAKRQQYYALAQEALLHYTLGPTTLTFVQHKAGVVFRVEVLAMRRTCVLKLFVPRGTGIYPSVEELDAGLRWLVDLAHNADVTIQLPVPTSTGQFVCQIAIDSSTLVNCTLQHWVEGAVRRGHFSASQVRQIGALMAKLHTYSRRHPPAPGVPATRHDAVALAHKVGMLHAHLDTTLLPPKAYDVITAAQEQIEAMMSRLGTHADVWGVVHGDLHHDNLLFYEDEVRPIDFTGLRLAHYGYDVGVTLYHIFYQEPEVRRAFLKGYQPFSPLTSASLGDLEAFVAYAAIDNMAWNSTFPDQVSSATFRQNLTQLVSGFCLHLAEGRSFLFSHSIT